MRTKTRVSLLIAALTSITAVTESTAQHIYNTGTSSFQSAAWNSPVFLWQPSKYAIRAGRSMSNGNFQNASIGMYSTGFGYDVLASGIGSVALGSGAHATGHNSFAFGAGYANISDQDYRETSASEEGSVAMGLGVLATGHASFSAGQRNESSGDASATLGIWNSATGYADVAMNLGSFASHGFGGAFGLNSQKRARASFVFGHHLLSLSQDSTVVGLYNDPIVTTENNSDPDRPLFIVGNGTSTNDRQNALEVLADGSIRIQPQGDIGMGMFGN